MSTKSKLLEEIKNKAQKIREKRVEAANNKTIEAAVFEFFKNIEASREVYNNKQYDHFLINEAVIALEQRLKTFDPKVKASLNWAGDPDQYSENAVIQGVTLWWGHEYIAKNNAHPSLYFDVSQILLMNI